MKIVVDTNIVFSALLNSDSRIGRLLLNSRTCFEFFSCKYLRKEIQNHLPKIRNLSKLGDAELNELISLVESRIFFIDEDLLPTTIITEAQSLVSGVDFDDFAFIALTNYLNGLLWTGDKVLIAGLQRKEYRQVITVQELWTKLEKWETENPPQI
ncbi:hypothetical protein AGMMS49938_01760 [Fibrobacterales bacterium]|nr:hypothetical protein AGMMS49938_01760 [Fibrobacterales bacterium]